MWPMFSFFNLIDLLPLQVRVAHRQDATTHELINPFVQIRSVIIGEKMPSFTQLLKKVCK